jgi:hypothetical protein
MALVRVYGRESTFKRLTASGAFTLSAPIYSFDPIPDPPPHAGSVAPTDGMSFELGRRFTLDLEVPGEDGVVDLGRSGHKCVVTPEKQHLDVFDVTRKVYEGVDGFRVIDAKWQN